MVECLNCGNCRQSATTYYCTARNEFVISENKLVVEREKRERGWKKGDPRYESRRRRIREEKTG